MGERRERERKSPKGVRGAGADDREQEQGGERAGGGAEGKGSPGRNGRAKEGLSGNWTQSSAKEAEDASKRERTNRWKRPGGGRGASSRHTARPRAPALPALPLPRDRTPRARPGQRARRESPRRRGADPRGRGSARNGVCGPGPERSPLLPAGGARARPRPGQRRDQDQREYPDSRRQGAPPGSCRAARGAKELRSVGPRKPSVCLSSPNAAAPRRRARADFFTGYIKIEPHIQLTQ